MSITLEYRDQHGDSFVYAGHDIAGNPTYARCGRHGATISDVLAYRAEHADTSIYLTPLLWESRGRTLRPVETTTPADSLLKRVLDLLWTSPEDGEANAVRQLTNLQAAVHDLDQHLLDGGRPPSRWTR